MTRQEKAELLFKRKEERAIDGQNARIEYEQHARAERENMLRLRALRLARDASLLAAAQNTQGVVDQTVRESPQRARKKKGKAAAS